MKKEVAVEPSIAKKLVGNIKEAIMSLEQMPTRHFLLGKIVVDNYIAFYTVSEKDEVVTIVRIRYSRRDWINMI